eukprot:GHVN01077379.1.p1 GENE.GHVN01077379.1~~GHVN01077379.1.p1  ORF type:complete len:480 (-),score=102.06 GHVN01077379.1:482-1921(-)
MNGRKSGWFKLKPPHGSLSDTLDLLVCGAYYASGRRRRIEGSSSSIDHISTFLLGVLQGDGGKEAKRVISFCKVGTGYSIEQLGEIRHIIGPHLRRYTGPSCAPWLGGFTFAQGERPDFVLEPHHSFVMEVKAAEIVPSDKFETMTTLRFPRAVKPIRRDKEWFEAWSENELHEFAQKARNEGVKNEGDIDSEEEDGSPNKRRKKASDASLSVRGRQRGGILEQFRDTDTSTVEVVSEIFNNLEFYVISGDTHLPKSDIERLVYQHGGVKSQSYRAGITTHVIAAQKSFRTDNVNKLYNTVVLHPNYVMDCVKSSRIIELSPKYLINMTAEVEERFADQFDAWGDSYYDDIHHDDVFRELLTQMGSRFRQPTGTHNHVKLQVLRPDEKSDSDASTDFDSLVRQRDFELDEITRGLRLESIESVASGVSANDDDDVFLTTPGRWIEGEAHQRQSSRAVEDAAVASLLECADSLRLRAAQR